MAGSPQAHSPRWVIRLEPRGATASDVAALLPLCDDMLEQAELVARHFDLPHGCASSICFYLGSGSPFVVPTSISAAAWPLLFSSFSPSEVASNHGKAGPFAQATTLPLPPFAMLTGLPICADLRFDFGTEEDTFDHQAESAIADAHYFESSERPEAPTPIRGVKMESRSPSWERRSSFKHMPYAYTNEASATPDPSRSVSPSPREAIFSGPLSPATKRLRNFAFNADVLRRRRTSSTTASPMCGATGHSLVQHDGQSGEPTTMSLAQFIRERSRMSAMGGSRMNPVSSGDSWPRVVPLDESDDEDEEEDDHSYRSASTGGSLHTFRRSRSSLFSSTQGTVWNEDEAVFEDARHHYSSSHGHSLKTPYPHHAQAGESQGAVWTMDRTSTTGNMRSEADPEQVDRSTSTREAHSGLRAMRVVDVATATLISPSMAATIVNRPRAHTSVDSASTAEARDRRVSFYTGASPSTPGPAVAGLASCQPDTTAGSGQSGDTASQSHAGLGLSHLGTLRPLKTIVVPLINRSPAKGTLAMRRRALTVHHAPCSSKPSTPRLACDPASSGPDGQGSIGRPAIPPSCLQSLPATTAQAARIAVSEDENAHALTPVATVHPLQGKMDPRRS